MIDLGTISSETKRLVRLLAGANGQSGCVTPKRLGGLIGALYVGYFLAAPYQSPTQAQSAASGREAFEVATIKPNTTGSGGSGSRFLPGGLYRAVNVSVRDLVTFAFRETGDPLLLPFQVAGGPGWLASSRFDIGARAPGDQQDLASLNSRLPAMLRDLLKERFSLQSHAESRQLAVYRLSVARRGQLGPQLRNSAIDCTAPPQNRGDAKAPANNGTPRCGLGAGAGFFTATGADLRNLLTFLSSIVGRTVIDDTHLNGKYDMDLRFAPETTVPGGDASGGQSSVSDGPSVFTAIEEQLGLKLRPGKGPVHVIVIDHLEQPSEN